MKNKLILILILAVAVVGGIMFFMSQQIKQLREQKEQWHSNYIEVNSEMQTTRDELGRQQKQVRQLRLTARQFQNDLHTNNETIQQLKTELERSGVEIKNLQMALLAEMSSSNEGQTEIIDTVIQVDTVQVGIRKFTMNDSFLQFNARWQAARDTVDWEYSYCERVMYWVEMKRKMFNDKGNKRFFLWRWLWPKWQPDAQIKSTNPHSEINALQVDIED